MITQPVIIVVAFNRPRSLKRLLYSLSKAIFASNTKLIISIDNNESSNLHIKHIADAFDWKHGEKEVIYHKNHMGLRKHILWCGDLSEEYGSVIILEDDLFLSPYFYNYTIEALDYYIRDNEIAGISLYSQPREDHTEMPFVPLEDNTSVYFLQFPSSWGQAWTKKQWKEFKHWYNNNQDISKKNISKHLLNWPESSWKKYFAAYLVDTNKYFVFPRLSLTTNFNDPGENYKRKFNNDGQTQIQLFPKENYIFKKLSDSMCIYDSFFELTDKTVKSLNKDLKDYELELDLYGNKELKNIKAPYIITSQLVDNYTKSYRRSLKPHELNIILNIEGDNLFLCHSEEIKDLNKSLAVKLSNFKYYYNRYLPGWKLCLLNSLMKRRFLSKIIKRSLIKEI